MSSANAGKCFKQTPTWLARGQLNDPAMSQAALTEGTGLSHDHGSAVGHALWDTLRTHVYPADVQCDRSLSHVRTESVLLVGDDDCTFVCAYFLNGAVDCIEPPLCLIRSSHRREDLPQYISQGPLKPSLPSIPILIGSSALSPRDLVSANDVTHQLPRFQNCLWSSQRVQHLNRTFCFGVSSL